MRTSLYMVARDVRPECAAAREAVGVWQGQWKAATFAVGGDDGVRMGEEVLDTVSDDTVKAVLDGFGPTLVRVVEELFAIQADALRKAPFMKNAGGGREGDGN